VLIRVTRGGKDRTAVESKHVDLSASELGNVYLRCMLSFDTDKHSANSKR
jgi:hypothetical protein